VTYYFIQSDVFVVLRDRVPASFVTNQLLGSYAVQSDIGDYDVDEHGSGIAYIKDMQFVPSAQQSDELLEKIWKLHMLHRSVLLLLLARLMGQYCSARCCLLSLIVVCNLSSSVMLPAGGPAAGPWVVG